MPETSEKVRLSDEQLAWIADTGQRQYLKKLNESEKRRMRSLLIQRQHQGPGTREESKGRLSALSQFETPETESGGGAAEKISAWMANRDPVKSAVGAAGELTAAAVTPGSLLNRTDLPKLVELAKAPAQFIANVGPKTLEMFGLREPLEENIKAATTPHQLRPDSRALLREAVLDEHRRNQPTSLPDLVAKNMNSAVELVSSAAGKTGKAADFLARTLVLGTEQNVMAGQFINDLVRNYAVETARVTGRLGKFAVGPAGRDPEAPAEESAGALMLALDATAAGAGVTKLLRGSKALSALKSGGKAADLIEEVAEAAAKSPVRAETAAVYNSLGDTADALAQHVQDARAVGNNQLADQAAETAERVRKLKLQIEGEVAKEAEKQVGEIVEAQSRGDILDVADAAIADTLEWMASRGKTSKAAAPSNLPRTAGIAHAEVLTRMAASGLGATIGATALQDGEGLSYPGMLAGAMVGFTFFSPKTLGFTGGKFTVEKATGEQIITGSQRKVKRLVREGGKTVGFDEINFESELRRLIDLLPDRLIRVGGSVTRAGEAGATAAGVLGGGLVAQRSEEEFDPARTLIGGALGGVIGRSTAQAFGRNVAGVVNPRRTAQRLLLESKGLSEADLAVQRKIMDRQDGLAVQIMDTARTLQGAKGNEREVIKGYMEGHLGLSSVPEKFKDAAVSARWLFDELGAQLIEVGIAQGDAAATIIDNFGTYVPRLYLKFEAEDPLLLVESYARPRNIPLRRLGDPDYLKHREDIPEKVRKAWGEINDVGFLLGKRGLATNADIATARWFNYVAASPELTLADETVDVARAARGRKAGAFEKVEEIDRAGRSHIRKGDKLYRQIPDRGPFGKLRGKYVEEAMADEIETMVDLPSGIFNSVVRHATAFFKRSKVSWNPATLMRNLYGQIPLTDMAGVSPARVDKYIAAAKGYFGKSEDYIAARRAGLFSGQWFGTEIRGMLRQLEHSATGGKTAVSAMNNWAEAAYKRANPLPKLERFHSASEEFNKFLIYQHARTDLGMDVASAVRYAKRWGFDYREVPRWLQVTRRSVFGAPFISFSYKALPRVLESAVSLGNPRKLWSFWKYPLGLSAVNEASTRMLGLLPDEESGPIPTLKRVALNGLGLGIGRRGLGGDFADSDLLPDYTGSQQVLMPFTDSPWGRRKFFDGTWTFAWGDVGEVGKGEVGKWMARMRIPFPRQLEPSNPAMQLMVASLTGGRDSFTGKSIVGPSASPMDSLTDIARFTLRSYLPALAPFGGFAFEKLWASFAGDVTSRTDVPTPGTALASEVFGLKQRPLDVRQAIDFRISAIQREINDLQAEAAKLETSGASQKRKNRNAVLQAKKQREIRDLQARKRKAPEQSPALKKAIQEEQRSRKRGRRESRNAALELMRKGI